MLNKKGEKDRFQMQSIQSFMVKHYIKYGFLTDVYVNWFTLIFQSVENGDEEWEMVFTKFSSKICCGDPILPFLLSLCIMNYADWLFIIN